MFDVRVRANNLAPKTMLQKTNQAKNNDIRLRASDINRLTHETRMPIAYQGKRGVCVG